MESTVSDEMRFPTDYDPGRPIWDPEPRTPEAQVIRVRPSGKNARRNDHHDPASPSPRHAGHTMD
jgi:hypothetical protein